MTISTPKIILIMLTMNLIFGLISSSAEINQGNPESQLKQFEASIQNNKENTTDNVSQKARDEGLLLNGVITAFNGIEVATDMLAIASVFIKILLAGFAYPWAVLATQVKANANIVDLIFWIGVSLSLFIINIVAVIKVWDKIFAKTPN